MATTGELMGILADTLVARSIHLGLRLNLFDLAASLTTASTDRAFSSVQLSELANVDSRFCLEWCLHMASARVFRMRAEDAFLFPASARRALAQRGAQHVAGFFDAVSGFWANEEADLKAFRTGRGHDFQQIPGWVQNIQQTQRSFFEYRMLPNLPEQVTRMLSSKRPLRIADVGCGPGTALKHSYYGYDIDESALSVAQKVAPRASFFRVEKDGGLPADHSFDLCFIIDMIHDSSQPDVVLKNVHRMIRPGGLLVLIEPHAEDTRQLQVEYPTAKMAFGFSIAACLSSATSEGPGGAAIGTCGLSSRVLADLAARAGFSKVIRCPTSGEIFNDFWLLKTVPPAKL